MFLQNWTHISKDNKDLALYELLFVHVDESEEDRVGSMHAFYSRLLSTPKLPASMIGILGEDG